MALTSTERANRWRAAHPEEHRRRQYVYVTAWNERHRERKREQGRRYARRHQVQQTIQRRAKRLQELGVDV